MIGLSAKKMTRKDELIMQKSNMWIPLITSVGVGAATFYTLSKNNHGMEATLQKVMPFLTQMTGNDQQSSS